MRITSLSSMSGDTGCVRQLSRLSCTLCRPRAHHGQSCSAEAQTIQIGKLDTRPAVSVIARAHSV